MSPEQLRRATHLKFNPWQSSRTALMKVGNTLKSVQLVKRADVKRGDDKDILRGRKRRFVRQMWTPAAIKSPTRQAAFGKAIIKKSRRQKDKKSKRLKGQKRQMWTPAGIKSPTSGKQPLAKKLSTVMENLSFSWSWERLALFTLAATVVAIFQKPFLRRRQRRPVCQSAILLPASHDTIGHYWTSGSVVQ